MSVNNKVAWYEGLFLRPQHFQQQDRYLERYIETRCAGMRPFAWGFTEVEIEHDLLAVGKLALRRAVGVFPDGTPFRMPDDEPLPAPLELSGTVRDTRALLGIPLRKPGMLDTVRGADAGQLARYHVREIEVRDGASAAAGTAVLEVSAVQARLLLDGQPVEDYACIPLAQIQERRADNKLVLDGRFMPTVLDVRACQPLATFVTELLGLLHQRGEALAGRVAATGRGSSAEIADFLLLQAVNRIEPVVAHLSQGGVLHPEDFYRLCVSAAGELATFTSASKRPPAFTGYRHDRLRESFEPVMAALRAALSAVLEQSAIPIPIEAKKYGIHVAVAPDRSLFGSAAFVLAARADVPSEELRRKFSQQVKIGPAEKIRDLVNLQLPGIGLYPVPVAPRQIPYHAGYVYFELDQSSELWSALKASGGIAMHVAGEFPGLALELWAIRGQG
jgi:type VI secretion system protein ImpJ